ncbi:MAG: immunoglobulin domain-containing protein, partial [Verrucomicrobiota bacterium]
VITRHPFDVILAPNAVRGLSVEATGEGTLTYQWFKGEDPIPGADKSFIEITGSTETAGVYRVRVSNAGGGIFSNPVTVRLMNLPVITEHPKSQEVPEGASLTLSVTAIGEELTYQWYNGFQILIGERGPTLTLNPAVFGTFYVWVRNPAGEERSEVAVVSLLLKPRITEHPRSQTVDVGETVELTVTATGTEPFTYKWFKDEAPISNVDGPKLVLQNVQLTDAGSYRVEVHNAVDFATSESAVLTVREPVCTPIPEGLIAWWAGEGNAEDRNGRNHGNLRNGTSFAAGKVGQAFNLDGIDDDIIVPNSIILNPREQITISAWYRPISFRGTGNNPIIEKEFSSFSEPFYQYQLGVRGDQYPDPSPFGLFTFSLALDGKLTWLTAGEDGHGWIPGKWYFIVGTYDGSTAKLYVNGELGSSKPAAGMMTDYGRDLIIGGFYSFPNSAKTPGLIDEVTIFNRALSAEEIQAIYNAGSAGFCKPPPPVITRHPFDVILAPNAVRGLSVEATGEGTLTYQWFKGEDPIPGADKSFVEITGSTETAGVYRVRVSNAGGGIFSNPATVRLMNLPVITEHPKSQEVPEGASLTLSVTAIGEELTYQWYNGFQMLIGERGPTLTLNPAVFGTFYVWVRNPAGEERSEVAVVSLLLKPRITEHPRSQTVEVGETVELTVTATGTEPLTYKWFKGEAPISNVDGPKLVLQNVQLTDAGSYRVEVRNAVDFALSESAVLTVREPVCTPIPEGLIAWWAGEGNANDLLAKNNGVLDGEVDFATGKSGVAFKLDGFDDSIEIPDSATLNPGSSSLTVGAWVATTSLNGMIFSKYECGGDCSAAQVYSYFALRIQNGKLTGFLRSTANDAQELSGKAFVSDGRFHHVMLVRNQESATMDIFVNGVLDASVLLTATGPLQNDDGEPDPLVIGAEYLPSQRTKTLHFKGMIDEVLLFHRALSAEEIQAIYNAGSAGLCQVIKPTILQHPQNTIAFAGGSVKLSVIAAGTEPLSYQWFKGPDPIENETSSSLVIPKVTAADAGEYRVTVSNSSGSIPSQPALLTVRVLNVSVQLNADRLVLEFPAADGLRFQLQSSATLDPDSWQPVGEPILANAATHRLELAIDPEKPQHFYRLVLLE